MMSNARSVLQKYKELCQWLSETIAAYGIIIFDQPHAQQRFHYELSLLKVDSRKVFRAIEFIHNYQNVGEVHLINRNRKHRSLRPAIDRRPVYRYNRLQTDLFRHIGGERIHLIQGRAKQYTLLRSFEELSFLPEDFNRLVRLVQKKLPLPSIAGYDARVLISYFEETYFGGMNSNNESCSQQLELVFEELIVYRTALASLPNYFDLRPIQRFNITSRTGLYVKDVECLIRQRQFTDPALRTILSAIHYELD